MQAGLDDETNKGEKSYKQKMLKTSLEEESNEQRRSHFEKAFNHWFKLTWLTHQPRLVILPTNESLKTA